MEIELQAITTDDCGRKIVARVVLDLGRHRLVAKDDWDTVQAEYLLVPVQHRQTLSQTLSPEDAKAIMAALGRMS